MQLRTCVAALAAIASLTASSQNVTIMESTSYNPGQWMDANWLTVATNLGLDAEVVQQSMLNDISLLDSTEMLIIASGLIDLPPAAMQTVKQFVLSGRSVYVQSEYQVSY